MDFSNFNFEVDATEELGFSPRRKLPEEPVSPWIIAEIQADLREELERRRSASAAE